MGLTFSFGDVIGMDMFPATRLLALCENHSQRWIRETWDALVLADEGDKDVLGWPPGEIITIAPGASGVSILQTPPED